MMCSGLGIIGISSVELKIAIPRNPYAVKIPRFPFVSPFKRPRRASNRSVTSGGQELWIAVISDAKLPDATKGASTGKIASVEGCLELRRHNEQRDWQTNKDRNITPCNLHAQESTCDLTRHKISDRWRERASLQV